MGDKLNFYARPRKSTFHLSLFLLGSSFLFLSMRKDVVKVGKLIRNFAIALMSCLAVLACTIHIRDTKNLKRQARRYHRFIKDVQVGVLASLPKIGNVTLPFVMHTIPSADNTGVVLRSKTIPIRDMAAPYNATIKKHGDGYAIFFRYDEITYRCPRPYYTNIGCAFLDEEFNQTEEEFFRVAGVDEFAEDPRLVNFQDKTFLVYNASSFVGAKNRTMRIAEFDFDQKKVLYETEMDLNLQWIEKNWAPFIYANSEGGPQLHFEYSIVPHRIFRLDDPQEGALSHCNYQGQEAAKMSVWPRQWGLVRGGAPPQKIGDQYLGFFHSGIKIGTTTWYMMGAYTFEAKPPFRLTGISHYPILFDGVYSSPCLNTSSPNKRTIYPCGFTVEKEEGRDVVHLVCGENDSSIKVVTLDKEALLKSLKKIHFKKGK